MKKPLTIAQFIIVFAIVLILFFGWAVFVESRLGGTKIQNTLEFLGILILLATALIGWGISVERRIAFTQVETKTMKEELCALKEETHEKINKIEDGIAQIVKQNSEILKEIGFLQGKIQSNKFKNKKT